MLAKLIYFKPTGKYYSQGELEVGDKPLHTIWAEVRIMRNERNLPGLCANHDFYIVLVDVPGHPYEHPHLIT